MSYHAVSFRRPIAVVALGVCLAGCVQRLYSGPPRSEHEVARIHGSIEFFVVKTREVVLRSLDGEPISEKAVEVLPGEHTVAVEYWIENLSLRDISRSQCEVTFRAEGGRSYTVKAESLDWDKSWRCWIENTASGASVPGGFRRADGSLADTDYVTGRLRAKQHTPPK